MRTGSLVAVLLVAATAFGQARLKSELRSTYAGSTVLSFTAYYYDANGNRSFKSTWDGVDSLAALMATTRYAYDANNRVTGEALVVNVDTTNELRYAYDANGNCVEERTLGGTSNLLILDSLFYNAGGKLVGTKRYRRPTFALAEYHNFQYNGFGQLITDTLYQNPGTGFTGVQAYITTYNPDGTVAAEAYWIEASGWTLSTTTKMAYDANFRLASATVCLGDGATNAMQDSLAYVYDANGNRSGQSHYDDTRTLTETIDYTWDMTIGILARDLSVNRSLSVACRENTVYVNGASQDVIVAVFDMSGRLVQQQSLRFSGNALSMPVYAGNGNYVVRVKSANDGASVRFSLTK